MIRYDTDRERSLIMQLLDVALKAGGLQNKAPVDFVLGCLEKSIDVAAVDKPDGGAVGSDGNEAAPVDNRKTV